MDDVDCDELGSQHCYDVLRDVNDHRHNKHSGTVAARFGIKPHGK